MRPMSVVRYDTPRIMLLSVANKRVGPTVRHRGVCPSVLLGSSETICDVALQSRLQEFILARWKHLTILNAEYRNRSTEY